MSAFEPQILMSERPSADCSSAYLQGRDCSKRDRPKHGGNLERIMLDRNLAQPIIDLSSAVNPRPYPKLAELESSWAKLPYLSDGLSHSVARYYQSEHFVLVPGSQWAIEAVPSLIRSQTQSADKLTVCLPNAGYAEHRYHWLIQDSPSTQNEQDLLKKPRVEIHNYAVRPSEQQLHDCDVCVLINPHNPLGHVIDFSAVQAMAQQATKSHTWLIVDEAFVDVHDDVSVAQLVNQPGFEKLIVLRSFGKFSGLPGARIGAIGAHETILSKVRASLPMWSMGTAALSLFERVVKDTAWLIDTKALRRASSARLHSLLKSHFSSVESNALLFSSVHCDDAEAWFEHLLSEGVYVRLLDDNSGLRFSIPSGDAQFSQLNSALSRISPLMDSSL